MFRFLIYALPLLVLFLALFGFAVRVLDLEPQMGSVVRLALSDARALAPHVVLATWLLEASGLVAIFFLAQGRCGAWLLDGLVAGWVAWIFRGPLLVITLASATGRVQERWWDVALAMWVLYSICGLALAILARRSLPRPDGNNVLAVTERPAARSAERYSTEHHSAVAPVAPSPDVEPADPPREDGFREEHLAVDSSAENRSSDEPASEQETRP